MITGFPLVFLHCGAHITHQDYQHNLFFLPYQQDITDLMGQGDFLWEIQMVQMCETIRQDSRIMIICTVCAVWMSVLSFGFSLLSQRKSTFVQPLLAHYVTEVVLICFGKHTSCCMAGFFYQTSTCLAEFVVTWAFPEHYHYHLQ